MMTLADDHEAGEVTPALKATERIIWAVLGAVALATLLGTGVFIAARLIGPEEYNVIAFTPQLVETPDEDGSQRPKIEGIDGPAIRVSAGVPVHGQLCVTAAETITVTGELRWQSRNPSGFRYSPTPGQSTWTPGCHDLVFLNPVPPEVAEFVNTRGGPVQFVIAGTAVPIFPRAGTSAPWETETFTLVPDAWNPDE